MRIALALILVVALAAAAAVWLRPHRPGSPAWRAVDRRVAAFDAPLVSTDTLAAWLAGDAPPLLLDARTPAEYAVSHLPGAVRVDPDAGAADLAAVASGADRVVVYCAVGVRSGGVAERLRGAGVPAYNLRGSIFRWAGEGRPLVRDGAPADEVHPYDAVWGRLLAPGRRAAVE